MKPHGNDGAITTTRAERLVALVSAELPDGFEAIIIVKQPVPDGSVGRTSVLRINLPSIHKAVHLLREQADQLEGH